MATPPLSRQDQQQRTREALVDAARIAFADKGFHRANLDLIAQEAGYSKGAVYSNFAGKHEVFFALLEHRSAERRRLVADARDADDVAREVVAANAADDGWLPLLVEFWTHAVRDDALRTRLEAARAPLLDAVSSSIAALAERRGRPLPLPARQLAVATVALTNGLAMEPDVDGAPAAQLLPDLLSVLLGEEHA